MLKIKSIIKVADNSAKECMILGIYNGNKIASLGDIVKVVVKTEFIESNIKKGKISNALIVCIKKKYKKNGEYCFSNNYCILLNDEGEPRGSIIFGPIDKKIIGIGYKKFISSDTEII